MTTATHRRRDPTIQDGILLRFGIDAELALALSMAKRLREVLLGVVSLLSWQWMEGRQIHKEWRARNMARIDNAMVRYRIVETESAGIDG